MVSPSVKLDRQITLKDAGLLLGAGTRLARFSGATSHLVVDNERLEALFAAAFSRLPTNRDVAAIAAAATHWHRGDKALANLRLVFAKLPQLEAPEDVVRLKAAELLFDAGLRADDLARLFEADPPAQDLGKFDPNQPRVPAGSGETSGRWTRFVAWLNEEVPVRDQDTGLQVGTQSRARAIVTNPLTVGIAGAAALFGGEALLPAVAATAPEAPTVIAPAAEEAETLSPFAQRYLSTSGGRLGSTATRQQLYDLARDYVRSGKYEEFYGDGEGSEEYIPGVGPGTKGSTYVDFTAKTADGETIRIQTISTLADGTTPTKFEAGAAARIRVARPNDDLLLIPKSKP